MPYCRKCGKQIPDDADFCIYCGTPVIKVDDQQGVKLTRRLKTPDEVSEQEKTAEKEAPVKKTKSTSEKKKEKTLKTPETRAVKTKAEEPAVDDDRKAEKAAARKEAKERKKQAKAEKKALKKEKKALQKQQKKEKKKKKGSFIGRLFRKVVILSVVSSLFIVAFVNPGLLRDKFDPVAVVEDLMDRFLTETIEDNQPVDALDNSDPGLIRLRYSNDEMKNAQKSESAVSAENHKVSVGGLTIDMGANNLLENDTLIVRDLGKKTDEDMAMALHCYDLSLASGLDEFAGNVKITIPLDLASDEYVDGMVYFNEETKQWEDLFYEVDSKGRYITAYMDHFTKVSPVIGQITAEMFDLALEYNSNRKHQNILSSDDKNIIVPANLFVEAWNKIREDSDKTYLYFQYSPTMRNVGLHNDTLKDLFTLTGANLSAREGDIKQALLRLQFANDAKDIDWPVRILGLGDSVNSSVKDLGFLNTVIPKGAMPYTEVFGNMMAGLNIMATALKLYSECKAGKSVQQAIDDNNLMIASSVASGLTILSGAFPALAAWPVTVTAIGIYVISISLDLYKYSEGLDELPVLEQAYLAYYKDKSVSFDGKGFVCKMDVPKGLGTDKSDTKLNNIKRSVNAVGLNDDSSAEWEQMLSLVLKNCEKEPKKAKEYIDDLYYKYADAFWNLPEDLRNGWFTQWMMQEGYDDEFIETMLSSKIMPSDIETWRKDKIEQTMLNFQEELEHQIESYTTKCYTKFKKVVNKEIIEPLNQMIYFLVDDTSLTKEQTFYDSLYCQDYRLIPYNQNTYFKKIEFKMDKHPLDSYPLMKQELPVYSDVISPMRFADVEYPTFYPYQIVLEDGQVYMDQVKLTDRYPHTPEFLPFVDHSGEQPYKNLVFVTTLYHYIQMGRPTRMVFRDVNGMNTYEDAQRYWDDPGIEASFTIPKFNKNGHAFVKVKIGGDGELSSLNGYWEGPWLGSQKQWYYFEIDTKFKRIYIVDTLGLTSKDFTIRFYKFDTKTKTLKFNIGWAKERAHIEFKITGKNTMVMYIEYNGDNTSLEFTRSTYERFENWENRQKFDGLPNPSQIIPDGD